MSDPISRATRQRITERRESVALRAALAGDSPRHRRLGPPRISDPSLDVAWLDAAHLIGRGPSGDIPADPDHKAARAEFDLLRAGGVA